LIGSGGSWLLPSGSEVTEQLRVSDAAILKTPKDEPQEHLINLTGPCLENPKELWRILENLSDTQILIKAEHLD